MSAEERNRRQQVSVKDVAKDLGGVVVPYSQVPQWLRDAHSQQKQQIKPPSGG
jgi:hypothetical protein